MDNGKRFQWVYRRDQLGDQATIRIARERYIPQNSGGFALSYIFTQMEFIEIEEIEKECRDVHMKMIGDPYSLSGKEFLCWNEILQDKGRIVFDFDFSDEKMIESIYKIFPRGNKYLPTGLIDAIENLLVRTLLILSPHHGKILCQSLVKWDTHDYASPMRPFCWVQACREDKISLHLTIPLWSNDLSSSKDNLGCLEILYSKMNEEAQRDPRFQWLGDKPIVDMSLTTRGHQLRLPHCNKMKSIKDINSILKFIENGFTWYHAISGIMEAFIPKELKITLEQPPKKHSSSDKDDRPKKKYREDYDMIRNLLYIVSDMASSYKSWSKVGFALATLSDHEKAYKLFDEFSRLCPDKYNEKKVLEGWNKLIGSSNKEEGITIGSLHHWAKEKNPEEYNKINLLCKMDKFGQMTWEDFINKYSGKAILSDRPEEWNRGVYYLYPEIVCDMQKCLAYIIGDNPIIAVCHSKYIGTSNASAFLEKNRHPRIKVLNTDGDLKEISIALFIGRNTNYIHWKGLTCYPGKYKDQEFLNIFKPYDVMNTDDLKETEWKIVLDHIRNVLCNGDEQFYKYVINWIAWLFQRPKKIGTMLLFSGGEGIGKSRFFHKIAKHMIRSINTLEVHGFDSVVGRFNGHIAGKRLVLLHEVSDGNVRNASKLKNLLTDAVLEIEKKGVDQYSIDSYHFFIGFTNHTIIPVLSELGMNRRICVIPSLSNRTSLGGREYHKNVSRTLKTYKNEIYSWFMKIDISGFHPEDSMPESQIKTNNKHKPSHNVEDFIDQNEYLFLKEGTVASEVYTKYSQWCRENNLSPCANTWFIRYSNMKIKVIEKQKKSFYVFNT